jgi:hypothetical protein
MNRYNSSEFSGQAFYEALERYKRYESKLVDTIKPTDETLSRLSGAPPHKQNPNRAANINSSQGALRSSFPIFPNGQKDAQTSESLLNNDDDDDSVSSPPAKTNGHNNHHHHHQHTIKNNRPISHNPYLKKQLPALSNSSNNNSRNKSAYNGRQNSAAVSKSFNSGSRNKSASSNGRIRQVDYNDEDDESVADDFEQEDDDSEVELYNDDKNSKGYYRFLESAAKKGESDEKSIASNGSKTEVKYDLPMLIKQLEDGFYIR